MARTDEADRGCERLALLVDSSLMEWQRERMLLWGMTYPELSKKHTEVVCTGAVFIDRPGLVRLYPLDLRYLKDEDGNPLPKENRPRKWSIISANVRRSTGHDMRPESYKIDPASICVEGRIEAGGDGWARRESILIKPEHMVSGLEQMEAKQAASKVSLGIVRGAKILDVTLERVPKDQQDEWRARYEATVRQQDMWLPGQKPVPLPEYKPRITFRCPGDSKEYTRQVLDWEVIELAKRHFGDVNPSQGFKQALLGKAFSDSQQTYLIFGNINNYPATFVVVAIVYPKRVQQQSLFQ